MNVRTIGMITLCAALAACNSKQAEETAPTDASTVAPAPATTMAAPVAMEPAPEGLPSRIAREVIAKSGQTCAQVAKADRAADGTITASCSGGENYQVYTSPGQGAVAVKR
jgi:hypothetical protein